MFSLILLFYISSMCAFPHACYEQLSIPFMHLWAYVECHFSGLDSNETLNKDILANRLILGLAEEARWVDPMFLLNCMCTAGATRNAEPNI